MPPAKLRSIPVGTKGRTRIFETRKIFENVATQQWITAAPRVVRIPIAKLYF